MPADYSLGLSPLLQQVLDYLGTHKKVSHAAPLFMRSGLLECSRLSSLSVES
jgi:hypothetical protein